MKYVFDIHNAMINNNLILVYEGEFTQEITKSVLSMAEKNMESIGEDSSIKRKVFSVMVECLQNIVRHSDTLPKDIHDLHSAIFMIGKEKDKYVVVSGNPIKSENVTSLKDKLERINSLDKEGLKALYKEIIKNTSISEKGGAGLGLVDMARKSGRNLEFSFENMNGGFSFFSLKSVIAKQHAA